MKKILIVDDEPSPIRVLRRALEQAGYEVDSAPNGHEAFLRLAEYHPDALITDIEMPRTARDGSHPQPLADLPRTLPRSDGLTR